MVLVSSASSRAPGGWTMGSPPRLQLLLQRVPAAAGQAESPVLPVAVAAQLQTCAGGCQNRPTALKEPSLAPRAELIHSAEWEQIQFSPKHSHQKPWHLCSQMGEHQHGDEWETLPAHSRKSEPFCTRGTVNSFRS